MIEPGFYSISNESYHASEGVSRSFLWRLLDYSPKHAQAGIEETEAMTFGTATHTAILEPERFEKEYVAIPADCRVGSGKGQKERLKAFRGDLKANGQTEIKGEDRASIVAMAESIHKHPVAGPLLSGDGVSELSGYFMDPMYDVLVKVRPDWLRKDNRIIVDLKKTTDARRRKFLTKVEALGYYMQAFLTLYGVTQITGKLHTEFYFVVIEDKPPYELMVYHASEEFIHMGNIDYVKAMRIYSECLKANTWPGYPQEADELDPSPWRVRRDVGEPIFG